MGKASTISIVILFLVSQCSLKNTKNKKQKANKRVKV